MVGDEINAFVTAALANEDWKLAGACNGKDPELFFPTPGDTKANQAAIAVCNTCPVRVRCLDAALSSYDAWGEWGVWGATTETERRKIKENGDAA